MAVCRRSVFFFLATLCLLLMFLSIDAVEPAEDSEFSPIHVLKHGDGAGCKGGLDTGKGNQCHDSKDDNDDDDDGVDDDVDDTYKVENAVKVSLSHPPESLDDDNDDAQETGSDQFDVLGH